jgi:hypothetical protein
VRQQKITHAHESPFYHYAQFPHPFPITYHGEKFSRYFLDRPHRVIDDRITMALEGRSNGLCNICLVGLGKSYKNLWNSDKIHIKHFQNTILQSYLQTNLFCGNTLLILSFVRCFMNYRKVACKFSQSVPND